MPSTHVDAIHADDVKLGFGNAGMENVSKRVPLRCPVGHTANTVVCAEEDHEAVVGSQEQCSAEQCRVTAPRYLLCARQRDGFAVRTRDDAVTWLHGNPAWAAKVGEVCTGVHSSHEQDID
jgi:hypothetical protein